MTTERRHPVIEIFGPTIQGEGFQIGLPVHFVRFGACDYRCFWCDSMYAVDPVQVKANATKMTAVEIADAVDKLPKGPAWVIFSGGNPAMHKLDLVVEELQARNYCIAVETQGTKWNDWLINADYVTISPKGPSSRMVTDFLVLDQFIYRLDRWDAPKYSLKIPIFNNEDYDFAVYVHQRYPEVKMYLSTGNLNAEGSDMDHGVRGEDMTRTLIAQTKWLAETVMYDARMLDVQVMPQLHVLFWGNEIGK